MHMDFMPFYNIKRGGKIRGDTDFMKKGRKIMQCCFAVSILAIMVTLCILNISRFYDILMKNLSSILCSLSLWTDYLANTGQPDFPSKFPHLFACAGLYVNTSPLI